MQGLESDNDAPLNEHKTLLRSRWSFESGLRLLEPQHHSHSREQMQPDMAENNGIAFLCIPGAFCPAEMFDTTVAELEKSGYKAHATTLPSVGRRPEGPATLQDDVAHIRSKIIEFANNGLDVVLVGSSYGAWVMGEAVKGLNKAERNGQPGGVKHMVYLASPFATKTGISLTEFLSDAVHMPGSPDENGFEAPPPAEFAGAVLVPSLSKEEQARYGAMLQPFSFQAHHGKLSYLGFEHVPSTAVITTTDLVVPLQWQRDMFGAAVARGRGELRKVEMEGDHCSMASHPAETARICIEAASL